MTAHFPAITQTTLPTILRRGGWLIGWAAVTGAAWFEVVKHGWVNGGTLEATVLTTTAVFAFVLPDLTFLVAAGQPAEQGYLPRRAVPFYNAMHRLWPPLLLTAVVGIGLAPLDLFGLVLFVAGLSWTAHVAMDRAAGYGLRNVDGSR